MVRRLYAAPVIAMLATYAVGLIIRGLVRGLIGGQYYSVAEPIQGSIAILGVSVSAWRTVIIVVALAVMAGRFLPLKRTTLGLQIRAALENPNLARASGVSTTRLYAFTFAFGAALAGLAGALMVPLFSLSADIGVRFLVQAFLSVMLGGVGTFEGPIVGSALLGAMVPGFQWLREPPLVLGRLGRARRRRLDGGLRRRLRPRWGHAAEAIKMDIATDITGAIAPSGNANWQIAQLTVQRINDAGGILGRPIELYLEDTASDPGIAIGNVRKLIEQHRVDVVLGGHHQRHARGDQEPDRAPRPHALHLPAALRGPGVHRGPVLHRTDASTAVRRADPVADRARQQALRLSLGELLVAATPQRVSPHCHREERR